MTRALFFPCRKASAICLALWVGPEAVSPAQAWEVHGVPVCTEPSNQFSPEIVPDLAGGAILVWWDDRDGNGVYAHHIDSTGTSVWSATVCNVPGTQFAPRAIADGTGGALITWGDNRSGEYDVYGQRLSASGSLIWNATGNPLCTATGAQSYAPMVADRTASVMGFPGAIVVWDDARNSPSNYDIYVNHVQPNGSGLWSPNGVAVCTATGNQNGAVIATDGAGGNFSQHGAIVAWTDKRNGGANSDIYARRVGATGTPLWTSNGVPVCALPGIQYGAEIVYVGEAVVIVWIDDPSSSLYAQKLDLNGNALWTPNGVLVTDSVDDEMGFTLVSNGSGGTIVTWEDGRNGNIDLFAQLLDANGVRQWTDVGKPVVEVSSTQSTPCIVADNSGGVIIAWNDARSGPTNTAIYAQHLDASGERLWPKAGVRLSRPSHCGAPRSVANGLGQAIVTWEENVGSSTDLYANRVYDPTSVDSPLEVERRFRLALQSSNPTRGGASLSLELPRAASVLIEVFDTRGRRVRALAQPRQLPAGSHVLTWDGRDHQGFAIRPGVYFLRVRAGEVSRTVKLVEVR